jgi:hypothetical protein
MKATFDAATRRETTMHGGQLQHAPLANSTQEPASGSMNWITTRVVDTSHSLAVRVDSVHATEEDARATGRTILEVMFASGYRRYPRLGDVLRIYREPPYEFVLAPPV